MTHFPLCITDFGQVATDGNREGKRGILKMVQGLKIKNLLLNCMDNSREQILTSQRTSTTLFSLCTKNHLYLFSRSTVVSL